MDDTIRCPRCSKDIEDIVYIEHRNAHKTGYQPPRATGAKAEREPYDPETYQPKWRQNSVALGDAVPADSPSYNTHMVQMQPRTNVRPKALDEAIERERNKPRERPSGHSLIR